MIAIIPARGGSTRIPRKNIKLFHGKPIIAYSIETAIESDLFGDVFVSTDNPDIKEVARKYGAKIVHRPSDLCRDEIGTQEVARHALKATGAEDMVCVLYATSPLLTAEELVMSFEVFKDLGSNYLYSVDIHSNDAGCFYFGEVQAFIDEIPLEVNSGHIILPNACDINTPEDWKRAEQMFVDLCEHEYEHIQGGMPEMAHFTCRKCSYILPT